MNFTKRSIGMMIFLMLITIGIYLIYWLVATKKELNVYNAQIPTAWLIIVPFANIYFLYKFAQGFSTVVLKNNSQTVSYFLLLLFLLPIGALICQSTMNEGDKIQG